MAMMSIKVALSGGKGVALVEARQSYQPVAGRFQVPTTFLVFKRLMTRVDSMVLPQLRDVDDLHQYFVCIGHIGLC